MKVVGLDLSLTSTGVAVATERGAVTDRIITKPGGTTLESRALRMQHIRLKILEACQGAELVVIEGPAYSRSNPGMHDRSGLWWLVVDLLWQITSEPDVVEVPPTLRAKYATGKGNAGKDEVLAAVVRRYPLVDVANNDEADALVLAAMGARHLGRPLEPAAWSPLTHLDAMTKVAWPDQLGGAA